MYEYISGKIADLAPTYAVIEAGGVGYYLNISLQTFSAIEGADNARLYVHFAVREDAQVFYGFATKLERDNYVAKMAYMRRAEDMGIKIVPNAGELSKEEWRKVFV